MEKHVRLSYNDDKMFALVKRRAGMLLGRLPEKSSARAVSSVDRAWFDASAVSVVSRVNQLLRPVLWKECAVPRPSGLLYYDLRINEDSDAVFFADAVEAVLISLYCEKWYGEQGFQVSSSDMISELKHLVLSEEKSVKRKNEK